MTLEALQQALAELAIWIKGKHAPRSIRAVVRSYSLTDGLLVQTDAELSLILIEAGNRLVFLSDTDMLLHFRTNHERTKYTDNTLHDVMPKHKSKKR